MRRQPSAHPPVSGTNRVVPYSRGGGMGVTRANEPDPEDPHFVHEETKQLATQVNKVIRENFQRHGTNEKQIVSSIKQFGVSEQSKLMMAKEKAAAEMAISQRVYGVWRNENARHAVNRDYCSRIGPLHKCFCGHDLSTHAAIGVGRKGPMSPKCTACPCDEFRYIPNEPEEVGEHWLSRRPGFVQGAWVAKCRCGHGSADHDPSRRGGGCNACRNCYKYDGHFLCGACDGKYHDHVTLFESEDERRSAGRPIKGDFIPLKDMDWEVQEIVFGGRLGAQQITGGGHAIGKGAGSGGVEVPLPLMGPGAPRPLSAARAQVTIQPSPQRSGAVGGQRRPPSQGPSSRRIGGAELNSAVLSEDSVLPPYCHGCGTIFRSSASKFCSSCGMKR